MKYFNNYLFLLFIFCTLSSKSQKVGFVEYGIDFNKESFEEFLNKKDESKGRAYMFLKKVKLAHKKVYSQDITFIKLKFNQHEYRADPVEIMFPETVNQQMIIRNPTIYGGLKQKKYLEKFKKQGNVYLVELPNNFEWEITNEHKIIAGYKCRKAILRKESNPKLSYIVWFTSQIPVAFTPVRYHGLPGATLAIKTPLKYIYAKNIEFKEDVEVEKPTEGIKLSAKEYEEMMTGFKPY